MKADEIMKHVQWDKLFIPLTYNMKKKAELNYDRYNFFSMILEHLANAKMRNGEELFTQKNIVDFYLQTPQNAFKAQENFVRHWLGEMYTMGLLEWGAIDDDENVYVRITAEGLQAYKDQRFHSIAASLCEAAEAKRLTRWTMAIAIISAVLSIISIGIAIIAILI